MANQKSLLEQGFVVNFELTSVGINLTNKWSMKCKIGFWLVQLEKRFLSHIIKM